MNSFLFSSFVPIIGTVQSSNSINYLSTVRPSDRRVEGKLAREYQGPLWRVTGTEVPRARGKKCPSAADRRARTKRREKKYFGGSEGAGETKKNHFGGSEKKGRERKNNIILGRAREKKSFGRERKKILASMRTQPTKRLPYSRVVIFLPIHLRSIIYWKEELQP